MTGSNRSVGLSPKMVIPTSVLLALGALLAVLDLAGLVDVDDTLWQSLLGAGGVTGFTGYGASVGNVQLPADPDDELHDIHETGF